MSNENALLFWRIMQYGVGPIVAAIIIVVSHLKIENIKSNQAGKKDTVSNAQHDTIKYIQIKGNSGNVIINGSGNSQNSETSKGSIPKKKDKLKGEENMADKKKTNQESINNIGVVNGNVVISNNQTGGVTAHTINYGIQPRVISDDWANQLITELKKIPADTFQMHCLMNSSESYELAVRIENILHAAGWTSQGAIQRKIFNVPMKNIILEVNKPNSASDLLWHWFNLMKFKPEGHQTNIGHVIDIIVGENI